MKAVDGPSSSEMAPGKEMAPADSCCNSPPSPSPLSTSTTQWVASPSRIRDSASRPRRSLLSSHFSASLRGEDPKVQQHPTPEHPSTVCVDDFLSKSLPSPPILAFLDQEEEEALEPSTPPHVGTSLVAPTAPRKSFRYRVAPRGKHKPRRLLFGEEEEEPPAPAEATGGGSSSQPAFNSIHGAVTPPHQSFNCFVPSKRIHMRDLR